MTESSVDEVYWERLEGGIIKEHEGITQGNGHVYYLHFGDCFKGLYMCQKI